MHNKNNKILVTGGSGFIGSALIAKLNQLGYQNILVTDFLCSDDRFKNLVPLKFDDFLSPPALLQNLSSLKEISTIFHLGACSSTTETHAEYLIENNYEYTKTLALWALNNNSRFLYASSAATYGDGSHGMSDKNPNDLHKLRPINMYAYSKHLFDLYAHRHNFLDKVVALKYFNIFGPNEHHKADMRSLVHKAYHQILKTGKVQLFKSYHPDYKDGEQVRDFLYVKDAVDITVYLAENKNAHGIFNIGSGQSNTWLTLMKSVFNAMKVKENIEFIEMPEHLKLKYQYNTRADISKLIDLGYSHPLTPLPLAVQDYITNYLIPNKYLGDN